MNRREEIRKQEEVTRVLATFGYQPTFHNLKQVSRRVNAEVFAQNPYQAVRDALLDAQRFKELEEPEPKTRTAPPAQTPVTAPKHVDTEKQVALVEGILNQEFPQYARVQSNVGQILAALENRPFSAESVRVAITECRAKRKLCDNIEYKETFQNFFQNHPEYQLDANKFMLERAAMEHFGVVTAQSLEDCLADATIGLQLSMTPAAQKAAADAAERQAIIDSLLGGKTAIRADGVRIISNEAGQNETYPHFEARVNQLSLAELRQIRDARSQARDYRNMSKEQLREVVREQVAATHPKPEQFLPLPAQFKVPNKEIYLDWNRRLILSLPAPILRDLIEKHGQEAIDSVLKHN